MKVALIPADAVTLVPAIEVLAARSDARALLFVNGQLSMPGAVDSLWAYAEQSALVETLGPDEVQSIIAEPFAFYRAEPDDFEHVDDGSVDILRRWELSDPRDRWKWTGEAPPLAPDPPRARTAYSTPRATIDAFFYVVSLDDPNYLAAWLANHPRDTTHLKKIWERKCSRPTK